MTKLCIMLFVILPRRGEKSFIHKQGVRKIKLPFTCVGNNK